MDQSSADTRKGKRWSLLVPLFLLTLVVCALTICTAAAQEPTANKDDYRVYKNLFEYWNYDAHNEEPDVTEADTRFIFSGPAPTVCANGCPYSSIQAAINAATEGETIYLAAQTFTETVTI